MLSGDARPDQHTARTLVVPLVVKMGPHSRSAGRGGRVVGEDYISRMAYQPQGDARGPS